MLISFSAHQNHPLIGTVMEQVWEQLIATYTNPPNQ
jgi:hypothetical protein